MDIPKIFLVALCCVLAAGLPSATPTKTNRQEDLEVLLIKEKESGTLAPVEFSKEVTFVHKYNDTEDGQESGQRVSSKITSLGGLQNKIQNFGGVQKTVLNNKIQYNFYFWLVPKNFTKPTERHEKR